MNKKSLFIVFLFCAACIVLKIFSVQYKENVSDLPEQDDFISTARKASKTQAKLLVMRIFGTTTVYRENKATEKATAQVGYIHEGSADIVVDLTKAEFQYQESLGSTNLLIVVPYPELDRSTVGIDPSNLNRVTSIPRTKLRTQRVFTELEDECKRVIVEKQYKTFGSDDVIEDAKIQAMRVLTRFYQACVDDKIEVLIEFKDNERTYTINPDVKELKNGTLRKD